jgi:hypothetical protein
MAVGQEPIQPIQAGASAQPLVTSASDVVTPDAVGQLTDSFRKGFITADDVVNRIGDVGQAQKKALLESLGEYVTPSAINSRMAAISAAGSQSALAGNVANAAQGIVQPKTRADIAAENLRYWDTVSGGGATSYMQMAPFFGHTGPLPKVNPNDPNSDLDYEKMANVGRTFVGAQRLMQLGQIGLQVDPARTQEYTDKISGKTTKKTYNGWGVENTPGSEGNLFYKGLLQNYPGQPQPSQTIRPAGLPVEAPPNAGAMAANPVEAAAQASAAAPPGVIQPAQAGGDELGSYTTQGLVTGKDLGMFKSPADEAKELSMQPEVKNWSEQKKVAGSFDTSAQAALATSNAPKGDKVQLNNDLGLIEAYAKLFDPQGVMREFKFNKASEAMTTLEKIKAAWPKYIAGTETFDDTSRQRLVNLGYDLIHSAETSAKDKIAGTKTRVEAAADNYAPGNADVKKQWLDQALTPDQQKILTGDSLLSSPYLTRPNATPAATPADAAGPIKTLSGGLRVYLGRDGQFHKAP